jgi:PII-like signaling protein
VSQEAVIAELEAVNVKPGPDRARREVRSLPATPRLRRRRGSAFARPSVVLAVAAGGALGSPARYGVGLLVAVPAGTFPWATFWVNLSGSLVGTMRFEGRGERLTIYVGESDHYGHTPLYAEIVARARRSGLAGATVLRGQEGFGAASVVHEAGSFRLSADLPMVVVVLDQPDKIEAFLPQLAELVGEDLVVRQVVDILVYQDDER